MAENNTDELLYKLRVRLCGFPNVYVDILIQGKHTFEDLHKYIYIAFNREDPFHLYQFSTFYGCIYCPADCDELDRVSTKDVKIGDSLRKGDALTYLFDYGDCWLHKIRVMKVSEAEPGTHYPKICNIHGYIPPQYPDCDEE